MVTRIGKVDVTLIGTGNLGTNLCEALNRVGHKVTMLRGREFQPEDIRGDIIIVAVRDDAISLVLEKLKDTDHLTVHTAGSVPMNIILTRRRGVFYPMQTFSKDRLVDFTNIPIFVEADSEEDTRLLELLAKSISNDTHRLGSDARRHLHLAAVFASNFVNHCYQLSAEVLEPQGIPFSVMLPLIDEVAMKVHTISPREAQTGPAIRNDLQVISRHKSMLKGRMLEIYEIMSRSIQTSSSAEN